VEPQEEKSLVSFP